MTKNRVDDKEDKVWEKGHRFSNEKTRLSQLYFAWGPGDDPVHTVDSLKVTAWNALLRELWESFPSNVSDFRLFMYSREFPLEKYAMFQCENHFIFNQFGNIQYSPIMFQDPQWLPETMDNTEFYIYYVFSHTYIPMMFTI